MGEQEYHAPQEYGEVAEAASPSSEHALNEDLYIDDVAKSETIARAIRNTLEDDTSFNADLNDQKMKHEQPNGQYQETLADRDVRKRLNEETSFYEQLYDLNVDHFANLPTREFMEEAKQYNSLIRNELREARNVLALQSLSGMVDNWIPYRNGEEIEEAKSDPRYLNAVREAGKFIFDELPFISSEQKERTLRKWEDCLGAGTWANITYRPDADSEKNFTDKLTALSEEVSGKYFDITRRQQIEQFSHFVKELTNESGEKHETAARMVEKFRARYLPADTSQD